MASAAISPYFPPVTGDQWEQITPADAGWNESALNAALAFAGENASTAVVILHRGRILAERYWRDWNLHSTGAIASAQKSITALLVGIAQEEGLLSLNDPVSKRIGGGWSKAPAATEDRITLRHLLTMTSGLNDALESEAEPGTVWYYNTPAYYRLKGAIEAAAGVSMDDFTRARLWERIGMQDSSWRGALLAPPPGQQHHCSARDMARFGLLALNDGSWEGAPIVSDSAYLGAALNTSQELNQAYGYLWWLNGKMSYLLPGRNRRGDGSFVPAAPADMVAALGAGDKKIYVVKSLDLVVARHGGPASTDAAEARSSFDNDLWQRLMTAAP